MGKYADLLQQTQQSGSNALFRFTSGKYSGGEFSIRDQEQLSIGRDVTSDVAIIENKVSRQHALLDRIADTVTLEDMGSTNGSLINGIPVPAGKKIPLSLGDEISIGESIFQYIGDGKTPLPEKKAALSAPAVEEIELEDLVSPAPLPPQPQTPDSADKQHVAKVALQKKAVAVEAEQPKPRTLLPPSSIDGNLSKVDPLELISNLSRAARTGVLRVHITAPFDEKIEVKIGEKGLTGCTSFTHKSFSPEKALTRFLLGTQGDFAYREKTDAPAEQPNRVLDDIIMEHVSGKDILSLYRAILIQKTLGFRKPIEGKLASLRPTELDSLQFMINAGTVISYLDFFVEQDDFVLLEEIDRFIQSGFLDGKSLPAKKTQKEELPEDMLLL